MKNFFISAMMLSRAVAFAQDGNVGINVDSPKATLHLNVASVNTTKNTNQGIIIPQLTKQRIADIVQANLIDGTLVYATFPASQTTFPTITQTDTATIKRVSQITTKDFYKYNAERDLWERVSSKRLTRNQDENYTLAESDYHYYIYVNSANAVTITVPETLKDGFSCVIIQEGAGQVTIEGASVKGSNGLKTKAQHSAIGVIVRNKIATVTGDTAK